MYKRQAFTLVALLTGRRIQWDAAKEQILGDEAASKLLSRPFRAPWVLG